MAYSGQNTLLNGLLAYWNFDSNANDNWLNNDGSVTGAVSQSGIINNCYYFDGVDDYIDFGDVTNFDGLTEMSFSFWIYTDGQIDPQVGSIISKYKATVTTPADRVFLIDINSSNIMRFSVYDENGRNDYGRDIQTTDNTITPSQWNHIVITWYGPNHIIKFYVNNELVDSTLTQNAGGSTQIYDRPTKLYFGASELGSTSPDYLYKGKIDEVGIWNRILSEAEISELYNKSNAITFSNFSYYPKYANSNLENDLISYWKFDNNAIDDFGSNDGTVSGATSGSTGIINTCYSYVSGDTITIPNNSDFNFTDGSSDKPFSISSWIKRNPTSDTFEVLGKLSTGSTSNWEWSLNTDANDVWFTLYSYDHSGASNDNIIKVHTTSGPLINDRYNHIVMIYDGAETSGGIKIIINGVIENLTIFADSNYSYMAIGTNDITIGADNMEIKTNIGEQVIRYPNSPATDISNYTSYGTNLKEVDGDAIKFTYVDSVNLGFAYMRIVGIAIENGVKGQLYTLRARVKGTNIGGDSYVRLWTGNGGYNRDITTDYEWYEWERVGGGTSPFIGIYGVVSGDSAWISNVTLTKINKNYNLGEQLITYSTSPATDISNYTAYGTNTLVAEGDALRCDYVDHASMFYGYLRLDGICTKDATIGQKYLLRIKAKGTGSIQYRIGGVGDLISIGMMTTDYTWYESELIPTTTSIYMQGVSGGVGESLWLGEITLNKILPEESSKVDELGIWNRTLEYDEIISLYNNSKGLSLSNFKSIPDTLGYGLLDNLVSYWDYDNNPDDQHRNYNGDITGVIQSKGIMNNSYYYDGVDDYIDYGDKDEFSFTDGSRDIPFSISCWMKPSNISNTQTLWGKAGPSTSLWNYICLIYQNNIYFQLYGGGGAIQLRSQSSNEISTTDIWYHVVCTYDGSKLPTGMKIHINGEEVVYSVRLNNNSYDGMPVSTYTFKTGTMQLPGGTYDYPFDGDIDELCVWKNRILSENDITTLYNDGFGLSYTNFRYAGNKQTNTLLNNLMSYWSFDTNANDLYGSVDGIVSGATSSYGKLDSCYYFDGVDDYVDMGDTIDFSDGTHDLPFSCSAWITLSSNPSVDTIIGKGNGTSSGVEIVFFVYSDRTLRLTFFGGGSAIQLRARASNTLQNDTWYHVACTYDGSEIATGMRLYLDGVECEYTDRYDLNDNYGGLPDAGGSLKFGSTSTPGSPGYTYPFNGKIDETAIWNKVLNADDVSALYNKGLGLPFRKFKK
jgi:Concanavalin A-like lectin/glucanases superfamily